MEVPNKVRWSTARRGVSRSLFTDEEDMPHKVSEVICVKCGKRWISVRPEVTLLKQLECENCGCGYVIETGEIME